VATCSVRSRSTPTVPSTCPFSSKTQETARCAGKRRRARVSPCTAPRQGRPFATARLMAGPTRRRSASSSTSRRVNGPAARRVERDEPPLDVGRENAVLHRLHHGGEEPLALPKRALHGLERLDELLRLALRDREPVLDDVTGCGGTERGRQHALEADTQVE